MEQSRMGKRASQDVIPLTFQEGETWPDRRTQFRRTERKTPPLECANNQPFKIRLKYDQAALERNAELTFKALIEPFPLTINSGIYHAHRRG